MSQRGAGLELPRGQPYPLCRKRTLPRAAMSQSCPFDILEQSRHCGVDALLMTLADALRNNFARATNSALRPGTPSIFHNEDGEYDVALAYC